MDDDGAGTDITFCVDVKILFPADGIIRVESAPMFAGADGPLCRRFVQRACQAAEIEGLVITPVSVPTIELKFEATQRGQRQVPEHLAALLTTDDQPALELLNTDDFEVPPAVAARDCCGVVRYRRYARRRITGWRVVGERMGMIKIENPVLYRKATLCDAIERELMSVLGIDRYETSARNGSAGIEYDPRLLGPAHIIGILDEVLANSDHPEELAKPESISRYARPRCRSQRRWRRVKSSHEVKMFDRVERSFRWYSVRWHWPI
jgi:Cu2+-exporting ATPase